MELSSQAFIGIDGGGSHTRALAIDAQGYPLGSYTVSGCNPHNIGFLHAGDRINEAVSHTLESLNANVTEIRSVFCGVAGIRNSEEQAELAKSLSRFQWTYNGVLKIDHDLSIAYEAALGDLPGICLIAGTGAAGIAKGYGGKFHSASNRLPNGYEPGSGYGVGMDAIDAGIVEATSGSRDEISNIARSVISLSHEGNLQARRIIDRNTDSLIQLIAKVRAQSRLDEGFAIVITGGLGGSETLYRTLIVKKLTVLFPQSKVHSPHMTPVEAAAVFALRNSKAES
tara:strand:+ start:11697 stop:12548 length:852 start_codon:yes stop_codon:yes gene_type:complete